MQWAHLVAWALDADSCGVHLEGKVRREKSVNYNKQDGIFKAKFGLLIFIIDFASVA